MQQTIVIKDSFRNCTESSQNMDATHEQTVEQAGASPADVARAAKRAAIQKQVDERRRQMAEEKLKDAAGTPLASVHVDSLLSPSPTVTPHVDDAANRHPLFTGESESVADRGNAFSSQLSATSSDEQSSLVDVFPAPRLSPSQQKALHRHQIRLLRGRANRDQWNEEEMLEWHKSLRNASSQLSMAATNIPAKNSEQQQSAQQETRSTSPLSKHFEDVIGSVRDRLFRGNELSRDASVSPIGQPRVKTPASHSSALTPGRAKTSPIARKQGGNTSRQLDFDSTGISFESSPLKMKTRDPFTTVYDLLLMSQSSEILTSGFSGRMMIAQHVSLPLRSC